MRWEFRGAREDELESLGFAGWEPYAITTDNNGVWVYHLKRKLVRGA